jgi:hypothetical protein
MAACPAGLGGTPATKVEGGVYGYQGIDQKNGPRFEGKRDDPAVS